MPQMATRHWMGLGNDTHTDLLPGQNHDSIIHGSLRFTTPAPPQPMCNTDPAFTSQYLPQSETAARIWPTSHKDLSLASAWERRRTGRNTKANAYVATSKVEVERGIR